LTNCADKAAITPLDNGVTDKDFSIGFEVPRVDQKYITIELLDNTHIVRGERKQEKQEKEKIF